MRELAYIQKIGSLSPIPGADKIEKANILGWELVVKKGEFQVGDPCVYVEIDSILPKLPCFEFLAPRKYRIKTIKLKGQISQGIAFHPSILSEVDPKLDWKSYPVGTNVTELLQITKYDPEEALDPEPNQVKKSWFERKLAYYKWKLFGIKPVKKGDFPSDVPKTDEERVQKVGKDLDYFVGKPVYITEKCEGTSTTFIYRRGGGNWVADLFGNNYVYQICSRNRIVYNSRSGGDMTGHQGFVSKKYKILEGLKKLNRNIAVQGEIIGPKIQGNIYKLPELEFRIFLMFDIDKQSYLNFEEMCSIAAQLNIPTVPIVNKCTDLRNSISYYVEMSKGKSQINPSILREGIVIRELVGDFSFKSINPEYLLKQE